MALDNPIAAQWGNVEPSFVDGGARRAQRFVAADEGMRHIRAFQFAGPFQACRPGLIVHFFQFCDGFFRKDRSCDHQEIDVAGFRVEVTTG